MNLVLTPNKLNGTVVVPSSKSAGHRALICAALTDGTSIIRNMTPSRDLEATASVLREFGAAVNILETSSDGRLAVAVAGGLNASKDTLRADCGESGSTVRFLIPVGLLTGKEVTFTGRGRLKERPLEPFLRMFEQKGIFYKKGKGSLPLTVQGLLKAGIYELAGNVSSQFFTGLLMILPLLSGDSVLRSTTAVESESYINITLECLRRHGVYVEKEREGQWLIRGNQRYRPGEYTLEGDYSQAAFWLAAGIIGAPVTLKGLGSHTLQGDRAIVSFIESMRGRIERDGSDLRAVPSRTEGRTVDVEDCPDLVPVLAVLGAFSRGITRIVNAKRVRLKECDRLHALTTELTKLGATIREKEDGLVIEGAARLTGGRVSAWNDHRIAMALAIAAQRCDGPVIIEGAESVAKSYPPFWKDFKALGGAVTEEGI